MIPSRFIARLVALSLLAGAVAPVAQAQELAPLGPIPAAASGAGGHLDPKAATDAYLATLPAADRARSDAYFEGGYWIELWSFLWSAGVFVLLLQTGWSARLRDATERVTGSRFVHTALYACGFILATFVLGFPLELYTAYVREHAYGLSNLTFGGWLGEEFKGLGLSLLFGAILIAGIYAVVRRAPRTWWIWGTVVVVCFSLVLAMLVPVFIDPIFNTPKKLTDPRVVDPILRMARANGIGATDVWEIDASKQSKRISANVSGALGTERITLNDNLLRRTSLPEIESVMGHEMGHYVLHHLYKGLLEVAVVIAVGFALIAWAFERFRLRFADRWKIRGVGDVAGLPLALLLFTVYAFLTTPVINTITRTMEAEADMYGLNAAREPDGEAQVDLKLSEYRKLDPSPLEEFIFYDHPSGRTRIYMAMRWKAENLTTPGASSSSGNP